MTREPFTNADKYRHALQQAETTGGVREARASYPAFTERHLQCVWYDPRFRPTRLTTTDNEPVTVESPGIWNLEAGPDFIGAAITVGSERHICGDVEIHTHPSDWKNHGHHHDARYDQVRIHVTYTDASIPSDLFPPGTIHIPLKKALAETPGFSFDHIDTAAYPYSTPGESPRCRTALNQIPLTTCEALLDAAGEERIRRKTMLMKNDILHDGREQVLYRSIFSALGYKNNKAPFRALAELVPENRLRTTSGNDTTKAYAILLGVSGLMPNDLNPAWPEDTRHFIRSLWDYWWTIRDQWPQLVTDKCRWNLSGIRPVNHPIRRMMAAAQLFTKDTPLTQQIAKLPAPTTKHLAELLQTSENNWWVHHLSLNTATSPQPTALLGKARINAIITNVFIPYLLATGAAPEQNLTTALPRESTNAIIKQMAHTLFGNETPPTLYRPPLRQQGLLQIFNDFCLNDRSRCQTCKLPRLADIFSSG